MSSVTMTSTIDTPRLKLSLFTGPTLVRQIAAKLREAGVVVLVEGTERVFVLADGADHYEATLAVRSALLDKHGTDFGLWPTRG
jgi:hypothetical protein